MNSELREGATRAERQGFASISSRNRLPVTPEKLIVDTLVPHFKKSVFSEILQETK